MGKWTSLLLFLPLIGCLFDAEPIPACPENKVCVLYVKDSCEIDGAFTKEQLQGIVWDSKAKCKLGDQNTFYAEIEIELHTLETWTFIITAYHKIEHISFLFGHAHFKFPTPSTVHFTWNAIGIQESADIAMETLDPIDPGTGRRKRLRYSFNISAGREKLIIIFGGSKATFFYHSLRSPVTIELKDPRLLQVLNERITCNKIKKVCNEMNCDKVMVSFPANSESMRSWQAVDTIQCSMGNWLATWENGNRSTNSFVELQCSKENPNVGVPSGAKSSLSLKLGLGIGGVLLLLVIIIGVLFFVRFYRRRVHNRTEKGLTSRKTSKTGQSLKSGSNKEVEVDDNKPRKTGNKKEEDGGHKEISKSVQKVHSLGGTTISHIGTNN